MFAYRLDNNTELRLLEPRHAEELYTLIDRNREYFGRWLPWVPACQGVEDRRVFITKCLLETADHGNFIAGIWYSGKLAGVVGINTVHRRDRTTSMFYWLGENFQGKGLVTETCRAIISHAFSTLQAHRVEIFAAAENLRSRLVAERLGFRHEGTRREAYQLHGRFVNLEVYAMLEHEWEPREIIAFAHPLTEDAELRLLMPHYAEEIFALVDRNREHLRWMTFTAGTRSVEDIRNFIRHTLQEMAEDKGLSVAVVHQGRLAGIFGADGIDWNSRKVEIGYWLAEEFQGKGLMTRAGRKMLAHLFETVGLNRVEVRCDVRNARSRALAERLGFVYEGTKRQADRIGGEFVDMHYFGLLREEWEEKSNEHQFCI